VIATERDAVRDRVTWVVAALASAIALAARGTPWS